MATLSGFAKSEISRTVIGSRPATMPPEPEIGGDYFPTVLSLSNGDLPNGWPTQWHTILYTSTDHDERPTATGGIYLRACNGDPTNPANWYEWDAISGNAEFAYLFTATPSTPTGNPIFIDSVAGDQTETPCVNKLDDGALVMTYHNRANNSYDNQDVQNTCISEGTDGVNFTRTGILLTYNPRYRIGNGHTGYFNWGLNVTSKSINSATGQPWKYEGVSLNGGAGRGLSWVYGSDDGRTWTSIGPRKGGRGRFKGDFPTDGEGFDYSYSTGYREGIQEGPYLRVGAGSNRVGLYGGALPKSSKYEALIDKEYNVVAMKPFAIAGGVGAIDEAGLQGGAEFTWGGREFIIYIAVDANNYNLPAILEYETVPHTWTIAAPNFGAPTTLLEETFTAGGNVPSTLQIPTSHSSVGTLTVSSSTNNLELSCTGGAERARMVTSNAYTPDGYAYIDYEIVGMQCAAEVDIVRQIRILTNPDINAAQGQQILLNSYNEDKVLGTGDSSVNLHFRGGGGSVDAGFEWGYSTSYNNGVGTRESSRAPMYLKIRIVPSLNLAILMIRDSEIATISLTGWDYTIPLYIYIENDGNDPGTNEIWINKVAVYAGLDVAPAVPNPPTMTATTGNGEITFTCPSVTSATGYKAFYGVNGIYEQVDFGATEGGTVTGLDNGTAYSVFMRSYNAEGDSEPSAIESKTPSAATGGNTIPIANAGPDQSVPAGALVTLDGTGSSDAEGSTLTYVWTQTAGDTVTLSSATAAQPTFTSPSTAAQQTLTFSLVVNDGTADSTADTVDIVVAAELVPGEASGSSSMMQFAMMGVFR